MPLWRDLGVMLAAFAPQICNLLKLCQSANRRLLRQPLLLHWAPWESAVGVTTDVLNDLLWDNTPLLSQRMRIDVSHILPNAQHVETLNAEQQLLPDQIHFMQRQPALPACPSSALLRARWCASVYPYGGCCIMQIILIAQVCKWLK